MSNENWVTYDNVKQWSCSNRSEPAQTAAKPGLTTRRILPCVWWDWQITIYYELLPHGHTLNLDRYCQRLDHLKAAIAQKRPKWANWRCIAYRQDNARTYIDVICHVIHRDWLARSVGNLVRRFLCVQLIVRPWHPVNLSLCLSSVELWVYKLYRYYRYFVKFFRFVIHRQANSNSGYVKFFVLKMFS